MQIKEPTATKLMEGRGVLRLRHVLQLVPMSKSAWWDGVRAKRLPQPIKLSPRVTVWRAEDIVELMAGRRFGGAA